MNSKGEREGRRKSKERGGRDGSSNLLHSSDVRLHVACEEKFCCSCYGARVSMLRPCACCASYKQYEPLLVYQHCCTRYRRRRQRPCAMLLFAYPLTFYMDSRLCFSRLASCSVHKHRPRNTPR